MNEIILTDNQLALSVVEQIAKVEQSIKELSMMQDDYKAQLSQIMSDHKIKDIDNEYFKITFYPESESPRLDTSKLKEEHEEVYLSCLTKSKKKAFVKITLK